MRLFEDTQGKQSDTCQEQWLFKNQSQWSCLFSFVISIYNKFIEVMAEKIIDCIDYIKWNAFIVALHLVVIVWKLKFCHRCASHRFYILFGRKWPSVDWFLQHYRLKESVLVVWLFKLSSFSLNTIADSSKTADFILHTLMHNQKFHQMKHGWSNGSKEIIVAV